MSTPPATADALGFLDPSSALPDQAAAYQEQLASWRREGLAAVDRHLMQFDRFAPEAPAPARRRALTTSYLSLFAPPDTDLDDPLTYASLRSQVAARDLDGTGADDDQAFFDALQTQAHDRRLATTFQHDVVRQASLNALSGAPDTDLYRYLRDHETAPGYQSAALPDYLRLWGAARAEQAERLGPVLPEVQALWKSFTAPATDEQPDLRAQALDIYRRLTPEQRPTLLAHLRLLADSLPAERKNDFWANFTLRGRRESGTLLRNIGESALDAGIAFFDATIGTLGGATGGRDPELDAEDIADDAEARLAEEFARDIAAIRNDNYDPVPHLVDPDRFPVASAIEQGLYGVPMAAAYSAISLVPFAGVPAIYAALERDTRDDLRQRWIAEGVDPARASEAARAAAPIAAIPSALLERLGASALLGRVPILEKALRSLGNRTTSTGARFAARVAGLSAFETSIETTQDLLTEVTQQAADALTADLPGPDWHRYLSQLPTRTVSSYVALFPLTVLGAAGGTLTDRQAASLAAASDTTILAAGGREADLAALRAAQQSGPSDLLAAAQTLLANADPSTAVAQVNQGLLEAEIEEQQARIDQAMGNGALPRFHVREDQIEVLHPTTGDLLGTADNSQDALGIADAHLHSADLQDAARVRFLGNLLTASLASARQQSGAVESVEASPGRALDLAQVSRRSTADAARIASQLAARETLDTGSSTLTDLVLGESSPLFRDGQRRAITKLYAGASITTVFHEETHALWAAAQQSGSLTRNDALDILRHVDTALVKSAARFSSPDRSRAPQTFLRPDFDQLSPELQDTAVDEALSELMEAEILRTRKGTGLRTSQLPAGLITEGITAAARLRPEAGSRFRAFLRAVRDFFGLAFHRAHSIDKALKSGQIDSQAYHSFLEALLGQSQQATHDQAAAREFLDLATPFQLGSRKDSIPLTGPPAATAFYSKLTQVLDQKLQAAIATPEQVKGLITNPSNGIKAEEIKWSGVLPKIDELAAANDGKIPKQALLDFLRTEGAVRFEEVQSTQEGKPYFGIWLQRNAYPDYANLPPSRQEAIWARYNALPGVPRLISEEADTFDPTFSQYTLPGGENYREVVLTIPEKAPGYTATHFPDVPNYIAHMRLNERTDDRGKPGLFIEEIQSDRHQEGRKKGYAGDPIDTTGATAVKGPRSIHDPEDPVQVWRVSIPNQPPIDPELAFASLEEAQTPEEAIAQVAESISRNTDKPADAPFRTTWPLAMFKRALRDAVASGMDWIGWTTGQTQAERYDLSKQVDAVRLTKTDGLFTIHARPIGHQEASEPLASGVAAEQVQDYIGKELALKAGLDDFREGESLTLEGADLKVGGQGMRAFYDTMLPKEIAKYVKQWGAGVQKGELPVSAQTGLHGSSPMVLFPSGDYQLFDTAEEAAAFAAANPGTTVRTHEGTTPAWRVAITPEMRRSITELGQPSFSLANSEMVAALTGDVLGRLRAPEARLPVLRNIAERLAALKRDHTVIITPQGTAEVVAAVDQRTKGQLEAEARLWRSNRLTELEGSIYRSYGPYLVDEDLLRLKAQPVHEAVADPRKGPLHGQLLSPTAWRRRHPGQPLPAEYDGAGGVSPTNFGGNEEVDTIAQALYERGLLPEPSADALWDALLKETATVERAREHVKAARTKLRDARAQATTEAKAWLDERLAEQRRDHSPRRRLLRSFALLDAILLALPPEIRAKVGGFAALARVETDEARLRVLRDRLRRADVVLEEYLRDEYGKQWTVLLDRSRPVKDEAGKRRQGDRGALAHAVFPILEQWMAAAPAAAEAQALVHLAHSQNQELLERESKETGAPIEEREAFHLALANMLPHVAGWSQAPAEQRAQLVEAAYSFLTRSTLDFQYELAARRERRERARAALKLDTGRRGTPAEQAARRIADARALGDVKAAPLSLFSFEQTLTYVFGEDSDLANSLAETQRLAEQSKIDAIHADQDALDLLFDQLASRPGASPSLRRRRGSLAGAKLHWSLTRPSIDPTPLLDSLEAHLSGNPSALSTAQQTTIAGILGADFDTLDSADLARLLAELRPQADYWLRSGPLSALEALTATLMWRQQDGKRHMRGEFESADGTPAFKEWHLDQAFIDFLELSLPPAAVALRDHMSDVYASEYALLNPVHRELFGIDMPRHHLYSPITVAPVSGQANSQIDPDTGQPIAANGFTPGWIKSRSATAIARPDFRDALQVFLGHRKQVHHWVANAALAREARVVLTHRDVADSIRAAAGDEALKILRGWIEYLDLGGVRDASSNASLNRIFSRTLGRAATLHLIGKASVLAIQSTQLLAAWGRMPTTSYVARLGRLFTGQLGWRTAIQSDYIQRRLQTAPPLVRQALDAIAAAKPSRLRHLVARLGNLIVGADALFTSGTYAILYDYHLKRLAKANPTLPGPEVSALAHSTAARLTDQIAQPVRAGTRSIYELHSTHPVIRFGWAYSSEARQKLGLFLYALATWRRKGAKARLAKTVLVYWLGMAAMSTLLRTAQRDWKDDDDDEDLFDDRHWDPVRFATTTLAGPIYGFPIFGDAIEGGLTLASGRPHPQGTLISDLGSGIGTIGEEALAATGATDKPSYLHGEKEWDQATRDVEDILNAAGLLHPGLAAAAALKNAAKDFWQLLARPLVGSD